MSRFLEEYGAGEEQRERLIKRIVIWGLALSVVGSTLYFTFRDWREEQLIKQFFSLLEQKNYQQAYAMWGCTQDTPCKYYSPEKFNEDWGPSSPFSGVAHPKIDHIDNCGGGVVFDVENPKTDPLGLFVDTATKQIGFAPGPRCPGRHFQLWEFLKSRFN
jgi:hypothetical protein